MLYMMLYLYFLSRLGKINLSLVDYVVGLHLREVSKNFARQSQKLCNVVGVFRTAFVNIKIKTVLMIFKTSYPSYPVTITVVLNLIIYLLVRTGGSVTQWGCTVIGPNSGILSTFWTPLPQKNCIYIFF